MILNATIKIILIPLTILCLSLSLSSQHHPPEPKMTKVILKDFINTQLEYPPSAQRKGKQGTVVIAFSIDKNAQITERKIIESVLPEIDKSALKLFDMILWNPPTFIGKPVDGTGEFKLKFNIKKYQSLVKKRGYDQIELPSADIDTSGRIYSVKELNIIPQAILGEEYRSLPQFISQNLVFPESAEKLSLKGDVKLSFIIESNGLPSNIIVAKPLGGGCSEEAVRLLQIIKWNPGLKDEKAVRTSSVITIHFDPADQLRNKHIPNQSSSGI